MGPLGPWWYPAQDSGRWLRGIYWSIDKSFVHNRPILTAKTNWSSDPVHSATRNSPAVGPIGSYINPATPKPVTDSATFAQTKPNASPSPSLRLQLSRPS
ncbi:hypothetical protein TorRG33x02_249270 [Trema orientale]|uniref:Uncharacterized protein n=1 Tax=Trema orientale TaxID=63057 RepID=A0A2P5DJH4_TREOI|nr:hypothetical protein TorRG33x02_249270 [Trema orientale]